VLRESIMPAILCQESGAIEAFYMVADDRFFSCRRLRAGCCLAAFPHMAMTDGLAWGEGVKVSDVTNRLDKSTL
jgi:hypothetical protein